MESPSTRTPPPSASRDVGALVYVGVPALLALLLVGRTLWAVPIYDDQSTMDTAQRLADNLGELLSSGRSVTYFVHTLDAWVWGDQALGWHATNILLHSVTVGLVAWVSSRLSGSRICGLLAAVFFAVHPVHVEPVASIAFRKDIIATGLSLACLGCWTSSSPRVRWIGTPIFMGMAFLAKEVVAVGLLPVLVACYVLRIGWPRRRGVAHDRWVAMGLLVLAVTLATSIAQLYEISFTSAHVFAVTNQEMSSYGEVVRGVAASTPRVLELLVFPSALSLDYPVPSSGDSSTGAVVLGVAIWAGFLIGILVAWRRSAIVTLSLLWLGAMLVPVSNLVPLGWFFVADRYLYAPSFGVCLLAALTARTVYRACGSSSQLRVACAAPFVVLIVLGAAKTWARTGDWDSRVEIWRSSLDAGVDTWRVRVNLAAALETEGRYAEAAQNLRVVVGEDPAFFQARERYARVLEQAGQTEEAQEQWATMLFYRALYYGKRGELKKALADSRALVDLRPSSVEARVNLGGILLRLGHPDEAVEVLGQAVQLAPSAADARYNLGNALRASGDCHRAIAQYDTTLALSSGFFPAAANRALALRECGRINEAVRALQTLVETSPTTELESELAETLRQLRRMETAPKDSSNSPAESGE